MSSVPNAPVAGANEPSVESAELAHAVVDMLADRQASDIVLMDLRSVSLLADYFILANGDSRRQMRALVDTVQEALHKRKANPLRIEGTPESGWIIMDYGGIVIHLFDPEARNFYKLEQLWKEAPTVLRMQ
jgi:ribosome-associated protein